GGKAGVFELERGGALDQEEVGGEVTVELEVAVGAHEAGKPGAGKTEVDRGGAAGGQREGEDAAVQGSVEGGLGERVVEHAELAADLGGQRAGGAEVEHVERHARAENVETDRLAKVQVQAVVVDLEVEGRRRGSVEG